MPFQPLSASLCGRNVGIPGRLEASSPPLVLLERVVFRSKDRVIFLSKFHVKEPLETGDLSSPGGVLVNASPPCPDGRPRRQFFQSRWQSRGKNASAGKAQHLLRSLLVPGLLRVFKHQGTHSSTLPHYVLQELTSMVYPFCISRWGIHSAGALSCSWRISTKQVYIKTGVGTFS